ncbi:hypothetical protein OLMES_1109 [Oleiphilus messinensis]|uniref:Uncharacterized protein n=1 Tax=Oleiphilus messinensis TaxID=141451 RepID=A0A1Y0I6Z3_9GAMM|nr:hypothetical protein OLMES_1109 [Oleiphilus messinensis]
MKSGRIDSDGNHTARYSLRESFFEPIPTNNSRNTNNLHNSVTKKKPIRISSVSALRAIKKALNQ